MKSHFSKKIISLILSLVLIICALTANVSAATKTYTYWDAVTKDGKKKIFLWDYVSSVVYYNNLGITSNSFATGVTNALNQWNTALGTSMSAYSTDDEDITYWHTIKIFGGDWQSLSTLDIFNQDLSKSGLGGYTEPYAPIRASDTYIANGYTIDAYNYQYAHIAILDISLDSSYSTNYNFLCTHEMGHALGWYGHSPYSSDVMQGNEPNYNYPLTNRDKRHVTQFYNYGGTLK